MLFLRSLLFQIAFYLNNVLQMLVFFIPFLLGDQKRGYWIAKFWARSQIWLHDVIIGTEFEVRGRENIPEGGFVVACKHQSSHETLSLFIQFDRPAYILKAGLTKVPVFGTYLTKMGSIPVERGKRGAALASMTAGVGASIAKGHQVLIFPEGTRKAVDAEPVYKYGIQHLYNTVNTPVLPVATNTGAFWPKNGFIHYPGKVVLEILPPIEAGLDGDVFQVKMIDAIETASNNLLREAASGPNPSPLAVKAVRKLDDGQNIVRPSPDNTNVDQPGEAPG